MTNTASKSRVQCGHEGNLFHECRSRMNQIPKPDNERKRKLFAPPLILDEDEIKRKRDVRFNIAKWKRNVIKP
jgi:hypothetical protein